MNLWPTVPVAPKIPAFFIETNYAFISGLREKIVSKKNI
jgi:hypothetical protein